MKHSILAAALVFALPAAHAWAASATATTIKVTKVTVKAHDPKNAGQGYDIEVTGTMSLDPAAKRLASISVVFKDAAKKAVVVSMINPKLPDPGKTVEWKVRQALKPVFPEKGWIVHAEISDDLGVKKSVDEPIPSPPS